MARRFRLDQRACGILLHPTSLPGVHGSGDLGAEAYGFIDFLAAAGQRWWQMLPIGPPGPGDSPYSPFSAFAGSPLLISLERLVDDGLLTTKDVQPVRGLRRDSVKYDLVTRYRLDRLRRAFAAFEHGGGPRRKPYERFCADQTDWLDDYALFAALKRAQQGRVWTRWRPDVRLRKSAALRKERARLQHEIEFERFLQYVLDRQWAALRRYAHKRGVGLIGDIPIFVAHDSSDVWANRSLFKLDADGRPSVVSGCPPDAFCRDGQLWGHPHYRWERHRATGFAWWIERFRHTFEQFDAVRIDHFLGFHRCWAVPGRAKTARRGRWVKTPGAELLSAVRRSLGRVEILAEDLGAVTREALALRDRFRFPGMRVLQFAFGDDESRYHQPHSYPRRCVVYTGTHDNQTAVGWYRELRAAARKRRREQGTTEHARLLRYLGTDGSEVHWDLIRLAYASVADTAIIPMQDVLGLGAKARMNLPATPTGNWSWRLADGALTAAVTDRLCDLALAYDRVRK